MCARSAGKPKDKKRFELYGLDCGGYAMLIGAVHNSRNLCWTYMKARMCQPKAALEARIVKGIIRALTHGNI